MNFNRRTYEQNIGIIKEYRESDEKRSKYNGRYSIGVKICKLIELQVNMNCFSSQVEFYNSKQKQFNLNYPFRFVLSKHRNNT